MKISAILNDINNNILKLSTSNYLEENEEGYFDQSLVSKGIMITYRDSQYKKKIKLIVNSNLVLDDDEPNSDKLTRKLEKYIDEYFNSEYGIGDFDISGMVLSTDINVHSQQNVSNYLKILQRVGKVKGFSPTSYECFDDIGSFCLEGNSLGTFTQVVPFGDFHKKENAVEIIRGEIKDVLLRRKMLQLSDTDTGKEISVVGSESTKL